MARSFVFVVVVVLIGVVLAGCFSPNGPDVPADGDEEVHGPGFLHHVQEIRPFEVETPDGVTLRGHVYFPNGTGPFATILNFNPYWNSLDDPSDQMTEEVGDRTTMQRWMQPLLDGGFVVALVNIRGTGLSEGCKAWMDASIDGPDINTVIDKIVSEPWSNGNVGMAGISWHGYTQYAALYDPHPALKALVPSSAVIDMWSLFTRQGAFLVSQFGPSVTTYAAFLGITVVGIHGNVDATNLQCPEYADIALEWNELTVTGDKTPYWQRLDNREIIGAADVPMWVTNGLTTGEGHITQVEGLWELMGGNGRMLLGQWGHSFPSGDRGETWGDDIVAWFDHHLRDGPMVVEPGVVEYQDSATGDWHEDDAWPPNPSLARLYLSGDSLTFDEDAVQESEQIFQGLNINGRPEECPGVQAIYVSPPLAEDVRLAGNLLVNLTVTSSLSQGVFGVIAYGVDEVGLCGTGAADTPGRISQAISLLSHRGHLEQGQPYPILENDEMLMTSFPFGRSLEAGERIVLVVTGGSTAVSPRAENPLLSVQTGPGLVGEILIPVVEGKLHFEGGGESGEGRSGHEIGVL